MYVGVPECVVEMGDLADMRDVHQAGTAAHVKGACRV